MTPTASAEADLAHWRRFLRSATRHRRFDGEKISDATPICRLTHEVHALVNKNVKIFGKQESSKQSNDAHVQLLAEHGEGDQDLRNCVPQRFVYTLYFVRAKIAEVD
jgi:hypothetical protein